MTLPNERIENTEILEYGCGDGRIAGIAGLLGLH